MAGFPIPEDATTMYTIFSFGNRQKDSFWFSVLQLIGPLIFLIFCNDLHRNLTYLHCVQFADDTTLIAGNRNHQYLKYCTESDLIIMQDWFNANKLTLNLTKSNYIIFYPNNTKALNFELSLNGIILPHAHCTKFLGSWLDDRLIWTEHVKKLKTKLLNRLELLKRSKRLLSTHALKSLYYAQIHSNIIYGLSMWGPMTGCGLMNQIQSIQDKAVACIEAGKKIKETYRKHGILKVDELVKVELCKLGYKLTHHMLRTPVSDALLTDHHDVSMAKTHQYNTRCKSVPNLLKVRNNRHRHSYLFEVVSVYSKLPSEITNTEGLGSFVKKCKEHIQK